MLGTAAGFIAAIVTLAGGLSCLRVSRIRAELGSAERMSRRRAWAIMAVSGALMLSYTLLALTTLACAREYAKSSITRANLRGTGMSLLAYNQESHDYPPSLAALVESGRAVWCQFHAAFDPEAARSTSRGDTGYSSFHYQPGAGEWNPDPKLVLAYERSPSTPVELRIFQRYGRCVLFGDGTVRVLDDAAFHEARRTDAAQRTQIGWFTSPADD
ncbi:MAG: hypothetical protein KKB50_21620 [Planctomycetes bacterium]|nr:hypothetical protein [Planctomycetota bacterium]